MSTINNKIRLQNISENTIMAYEPKNFEHLLGLPGFSENLLKNHFTLYQGYVTNTNKVRDLLSNLLKEGKTATPEFAELTRRLGWEFNGMRLHELYFSNLSKTPSKLSATNPLGKKIQEQFGSIENWEKEARAICTMRGIGWAVLYFDHINNQLINCWVNEHDVGHLSTCVPLVVIDVFEHAYITDFGIKRADYVDAIFKFLDFAPLEERYLKVGGK